MITISLIDFHLQPVAVLQDKWGQVLELEIEAYKTHISECDRIMPKAIWSASKSVPCINTGVTDEIVKKATEYCNKLN